MMAGNIALLSSSSAISCRRALSPTLADARTNKSGVNVSIVAGSPTVNDCGEADNRWAFANLTRQSTSAVPLSTTFSADLLLLSDASDNPIPRLNPPYYS